MYEPYRYTVRMPKNWLYNPCRWMIGHYFRNMLRGWNTVVCCDKYPWYMPIKCYRFWWPEIWCESVSCPGRMRQRPKLPCHRRNGTLGRIHDVLDISDWWPT